VARSNLQRCVGINANGRYCGFSTPLVKDGFWPIADVSSTGASQSWKKFPARTGATIAASAMS
jgi:hypothetical protein